MNPFGHLDGINKDYIRTIRGHRDSNYATNPDDQKIVSGTQVFLNRSPVMAKSSTQKVVTLSVTEAELYAATSCAHDMLFVWQMMQAMQLRVKLPMLLQCDNKGTINLSKNLSTGDKTCHVDVQIYMLCNLNKQKLIHIEWIDGIKKSADLGTKNLNTSSHKKHTTTLCGNSNDIQSILK